MTENSFIPPKSPKDICFNELDFTQKLFDPDKFLQEHRKNISLEKMRDDLGIYLKILRSAMIELINKDYTDFVTLSSNLIGLDKAINNLETPLGQLKEEMMQVRQCLDDTISDMTSNLDKHQEIKVQKQRTNSLIKYHKSITKLSNILSSCETPEAIIKPDVLERAAIEFNHLKFHVNRCKSSLSTEEITQINELHKHFKAHLSKLLVSSDAQKESVSLIRCLRIYISLDEMASAEEVVRKKIIVPAVENIISDYSFQNNPLGLKGTYEKLEQVLDTSLHELLELTLNPNRQSISGFNFLVNSYWPEIEQRIEDYLPIIFAPGNPELFHQRYLESLNFLLMLEKKCGTIESINQFKLHPQYKRFLSKWNLPVYYQLRFQEIAGSAESILFANVSSLSIKTNISSIDSDDFTLHATCIIWDCLQRIWAKDVYLPQLLHRFWKLCLQLCSRYQEWCRSSLKQTWLCVKVNETDNGSGSTDSQRLEFLVRLYTDIEKLCIKLTNFTDITNKVDHFSDSVMNLINDSIKDIIKDFNDYLSLVTQEIVNELLRYSVTHLRQISDIPRLFRRTNREVPTKPCAYVKRALDFLITFCTNYKNIIPQTFHHWLVLTLKSLTEQYKSLVVDVITSVQKTEESLKRLKKIRDKSAGISTSESQGTNDDQKIRIQLFIDVSSYVQMVKDLGIQEDEIEELKTLLEYVETATKNKLELK